MGFRKRERCNVRNADTQKLLDCMQKIGEGDYSYVDPGEFEDASLSVSVNNMIDGIKKNNNKFVMQLNEAMRKIGDSSCVKVMIEQVGSQAASIKSMENAGVELKSSIGSIADSVGSIRENSHKVIETSRESVMLMESSITAIDDSCNSFVALRERITELEGKLDSINSIIADVKKIANKSSMLALNASIEAARAGEAGRGFSVVALQMQELSKSTAESTGDVVMYISELRESMEEMFSVIIASTEALEDGNRKVRDSSEGIREMENRMSEIGSSIDGIFGEVGNQAKLSQSFMEAVASISDSYNTLSDECFSTGGHLYRISRLIDKARSDMARQLARLTTLDWITVFEIDHLIFTWRQYNNLVGYEKLKLEQVNNPDGCKLGKWISAQKDPVIINSKEFKNVKDIHRRLHENSVDCFNAAAGGDRERALVCFDKAYGEYEKLISALDALRRLIRSTGDRDETKLGT